MYTSATNTRGIVCLGRPFSHPLPVNTFIVWHYNFNAEILVKLVTNIHSVSGNCCKGFLGQMSKVEVILKWKYTFPAGGYPQFMAIHPLSVWQRHNNQWCGIIAHMFTEYVNFSISQSFRKTSRAVGVINW